MKLLFALVSAFCLLPSASATPVTSALTGRVTSQNAPAAGVTVTVTSPALMQPRMTTTGTRGTYWIGALPPGRYEVTFSRAGLTTLTRRATIELARVARADATLDPSEDEESITSTVTTLTVSDTTEITTHFPDAMFDRLPIRRDPRSAASIAPGSFSSEAMLIDGSFVAANGIFGEEIIEEVTVIRGGLPVEYGRFGGGAITAITRSGGERFHLSLRDTMTSGDHLFESASSGRLIPERLWFFAAGWSGEGDINGLDLELSAQPGGNHNIVAEVLEDVRALRYTGVASERLTIEATADSSTLDTFSLRGTYAFGDHVLSLGGSALDTRALFVRDRLSFARWTLNAGLRYERGQDLAPRAALTYDLLGNGRHALAATYGEYDDPSIDITSIGYAMAIGSSGTARIDAFRRETEGATTNDLQLDGRYRLFDQFEFGANYTYAEEAANAWFSAEVPIGDHRFGATVLQRYLDSVHATDFAVRYAIPFPRFTLTLAGDMRDAFDSREVRFWARISL